VKLLHNRSVKALIVYGSMIAAFVLSFSVERGLADFVGFSEETAWLFPIAVDMYALSAIIRNREVLISVGGMVALNVTAHLVHTGGNAVNTWVTAIVSAVPPLILWRTHHVGQGSAGVNTQAETVNTQAETVNTPPDLPVPDPAAVIAAVVAKTVQPFEHSWFGIEVPPAKRIERGVHTTVNTPIQEEILSSLASGNGVRKTAELVGCSPGYVSRIKRENSQ
jgi:hypothetical protein